MDSTRLSTYYHQKVLTVVHGKLAAGAIGALKSEPERLRHGKLVLRSLRRIFQLERKENLSVFQATEHLRVISLQDVLLKVKAAARKSANGPSSANGADGNSGGQESPPTTVVP